MSDTIYRQDAIDAHCELCPDQHICCPIHNGNICPDIEVFRLLPSAQPHWIPCSERNPDRDGKYLVTSPRYKRVSVKIFTLKYWWEEGMPLAWMPLPKPYRGENDD